MRGRDAFVWHARVKPIGLPLAAFSAGLRMWRGDGLPAAARSAAMILALTVVEAELEFTLRRARRRRAIGRHWRGHESHEKTTARSMAAATRSI